MVFLILQGSLQKNVWVPKGLVKEELKFPVNQLSIDRSEKFKAILDMEGQHQKDSNFASGMLSWLY